MALAGYGMTLREVLRYGYAGFLSFLLAVLVAPVHTQRVLTILGPVLSPLIALALGAALYSIYKPVICDLLFYPTAELLHLLLEPLWGYDRKARTRHACRSHYLEEVFAVSHSDRIEAYRVVRDSSLFDEKQRTRFHVQHSEVHILYMTATIAMLAGWLRDHISHEPIAPGLSSCVLLGGGVAFLLGGLLADILLCRQECAYVRTLDRVKLGELLEEAHLGKRPPPEQ